MGQLVLSMRGRVVLLLAGLCALVAAFWPSILSLVEAWQRDEYSHGPIVVVLSLLIGGRHLSRRPMPMGGTWWGLVALVVGGGAWVLSRYAAFEPLAYYGFWTCLIGLSLAAAGPVVTRALAVPFAYLLFSFPLPLLVFIEASAALQVVSSDLGTLILRLCGISVFQQGNIIDLGVYQLQVAEACSGLRYVIPLAAFSFLMAFLMRDRMWKRVVVFASAFPLAILMNAVRIALVGITVDRWGPTMAEGLLHFFEGGVFFLVCTVILFAEALLLMRGSGGMRWDYMRLPPMPRFYVSDSSPCVTVAALLICVGLACVSLSGLGSARGQERHLRIPLLLFPVSISDWRGMQHQMSQEELSVLKPTDYLLADYSSPAMAAQVNIYVAFYARQTVGAAIHSPSLCLPGSGWKIESRDVVPVNVEGKRLSVTREIIRKGSEEQIVYYWFQERGRTMNDQYSAKWFFMLDAIVQGRTDGALVRYVTPKTKDETLRDAEQRLQAFVGVSYPLLRTYLPAD